MLRLSGLKLYSRWVPLKQPKYFSLSLGCWTTSQPPEDSN